MRNNLGIITLISFTGFFALSLFMGRGDLALMNGSAGSVLAMMLMTIYEAGLLSSEFDVVANYQEACRLGDLDQVISILECYKEGFQFAQKRIVCRMITAGIQEAYENKHPEVLRYLLTQKVILGCNMEKFPMNWFLKACSQGNSELVQVLIAIPEIRVKAHKVYPNIIGSGRFNSPLSLASDVSDGHTASKKLEVVNLLLSIPLVKETAHQEDNLALVRASYEDGGELIVKRLLELENVRDTAHVPFDNTNIPRVVVAIARHSIPIGTLRRVLQIDRVRENSMAYLLGQVQMHQRSYRMDKLIRLMQVSCIYDRAHPFYKTLYKESALTALNHFSHKEMWLYLRKSMDRAVFFIKRVFRVNLVLKGLKRIWLFACRYNLPGYLNTKVCNLPIDIWRIIIEKLCKIQGIGNARIVSLLVVDSLDIRDNIVRLGCDDADKIKELDHSTEVSRIVSSPLDEVSSEPRRIKSL